MRVAAMPLSALSLHASDGRLLLGVRRQHVWRGQGGVAAWRACAGLQGQDPGVHPAAGEAAPPTWHRHALQALCAMVPRGVSGEQGAAEGHEIAGQTGRTRWQASPSSPRVLQGLDWVARNHASPALVHMSIEGAFSAAVNAAVDGLVRGRQLHVVASAGTSRPGGDGRGGARGGGGGCSPEAVHLQADHWPCVAPRRLAAGNTGTDACQVSPGSTPSALTVSAIDSDWSRWPYGNWGACVDVFAPGVSILSAGGWARAEGEWHGREQRVLWGRPSVRMGAPHSTLATQHTECFPPHRVAVDPPALPRHMRRGVQASPLTAPAWSSRGPPWRRPL